MEEGSPWYKAVKNLAELCFSALCKVELVSDEIEYLAEEISKQSVEGVYWSHQMSKGRDKLKIKLLSKTKLVLEDLENS